MILKIISFIAASIMLISGYEIVLNKGGTLWYIIGGAGIILLAVMITVQKLNSPVVILKHLEECEDGEDCVAYKEAVRRKLVNPDLPQVEDTTTYRIREQKLFEKFGKTPAYGEYDFTFFSEGLKKDIDKGIVKKVVKPNLSELNEIVSQAKDYAARKDSQWYHTQIELKKIEKDGNSFFVSSNEKETSNHESDSFSSYQKLIQELEQINFDHITRDEIGGVKIVFA